MEVDVTLLIEKLQDLKERLYDINLELENDEHLDEDDFTLAVAIAVLKKIDSEEE